METFRGNLGFGSERLTWMFSVKFSLTQTTNRHPHMETLHCTALHLYCTSLAMVQIEEILLEPQSRYGSSISNF